MKNVDLSQEKYDYVILGTGIAETALSAYYNQRICLLELFLWLTRNH